jgi:ferredoxin
MLAGEKIELLKTSAREIGARLDLLERRIAEIERSAPARAYSAVVDSALCIGCGLCERGCQVRAIKVGDTAVVDEKRCTGCGRCVRECPRGAVALRKDTNKDVS